MGFVGRLEDLGVTDIFQILSLGKRTGKLTLTRRRQQGLVVFLNGRIVYCQTNAVRETLGSILINRRFIDEATLLAALDQQQAGSAEEPLGSILVSMGAISRDTLNEVVYEQVKVVLAELLGWEAGVFQFEPVKLREDLGAGFDANEFLVEDGLRPEEVVLDLLTKLDESRVDLDEEKSAPGEEGGPGEGDFRAAAGRSGRKIRPRGFASLKTIMSELRRQPVTFTGEITLMLLRYTAELVNRSVLFGVRDDSFVGIGQFGIEIDGVSADRRIREIQIPVDEPSILKDVAESREPYRGRLDKNTWNNYLIRQLGGMAPRDVVVVPIIVEGRAVAIIYGDNLPEDTPIGPTEGLELLMIQAGLLIEKRSLQAKLEETSRRDG